MRFGTLHASSGGANRVNIRFNGSRVRLVHRLVHKKYKNKSVYVPILIGQVDARPARTTTESNVYATRLTDSLAASSSDFGSVFTSTGRTRADAAFGGIEERARTEAALPLLLALVAGAVGASARS